MKKLLSVLLVFIMLTVTAGYAEGIGRYITVSDPYYTDGVKIAEKTFLYMSSGYATGTQGYMELNDFSDIDEAWIVNVS